MTAPFLPTRSWRSCRTLPAQTVRMSMVFAVMAHPTITYAETVKIVGIGAMSCAEFNRVIMNNPAEERALFAWAQGFMSGALMRAPPGSDDDLDLMPARAPLQQQAAFLRTFCAAAPEKGFADAVMELYCTLR